MATVPCGHFMESSRAMVAMALAMGWFRSRRICAILRNTPVRTEFQSCVADSAQQFAAALSRQVVTKPGK